MQSVATKIIVDREREIDAFDSEEYWTIDAKLEKADTKETFLAKFYGDSSGKIALSNEAETKKVLEAVEKSKFTVIDVKTGEKKRYPAPPFITSTMQQEASRKLSYTTKKTMQIAQQLYEGVDVKGIGTIGLITYMRTDSLRISDDARLEVTNYITGKYGAKYAPITPKIYKSKKSAQDAHEAIRPSDVNLTPEKVKESLSNDQFKLYSLIWKRFVAAHMNDALLEAVNADIKCNDYIFRASGSTVLFDGFMLYIQKEKMKKKKMKMAQTFQSLKKVKRRS